MPDWLATALLGVIEGLTEFVPVSSTGHLLIAEHWLPRQSDLFNVVVQCGAVLAVLPLFSRRCRQLTRANSDPLARQYLLKLLAAFAVTVVGGVVLEKAHFRLPHEPYPIGCALLVGGVLFLVIERWLGRSSSATGVSPGSIASLSDEISWRAALLVGAGQLVAIVFPGASRSGTTILCALALGAGRPAATEFCFLLGIPTLLAAGGLKIAKALHSGVTEPLGPLVVATLVAAIVSIVTVRWFLRYVQTHNFYVFGIYRIVVGVLIVSYFG